MGEDPMNPENLKLILGILGACAAIIGGLYGVVTVPILRALKGDAAALRAELKTAVAELRTDMIAMEARLNQRIDTRLVHR